MDLPPNITPTKSGKYALRMIDPVTKDRKRFGTFRTIELALEKKREILSSMTDSRNEEKESDLVFRNLPEQSLAGSQLWDLIINRQEELNRIRPDLFSDGVIEVEIKENKPFAVAIMSDLHLGNPFTNYSAIRRDTNIILNTDGMYVISPGDFIDNWIIGRLQQKQRDQLINLDTELKLARTWLRSLDGKIIAIVSGNHDLWTLKQSGIDFVKETFDDINFAYDEYEVNLDLLFGNKQSKRMKIRHKWRGTTSKNPTHAIEESWVQGKDEFDIGIGGHTHFATLFRSFIRHNLVRYAVLIGTFKVQDKYPKELGLMSGYNNMGSGAIIFWPDGRMYHCDDLEIARTVLNCVRN